MRSQSCKSFQSEPKITAFSEGCELTGKGKRKVNDTNQTVWNGFSLSPATCKEVRASPMRYKDYENSKRTISHLLSGPKQEKRYSKGSNLSEMINRGYSEDKLGRLTKKVVTGGKVVMKNAMSFENLLISPGIAEAYQDVHSGHYLKSEKRHKISSAINEDRKVSQISTLPGGHKEVPDRKTPVKHKPEYYSSVYCLKNEKNDEKVLENTNPCLRIKRNTETSYEKERIFGVRVERKGPKRTTLPAKIENESGYFQIGSEKTVIFN